MAFSPTSQSKMHISIAFNLEGTEAQGTKITKWKGEYREMSCKHET